MRHRHTAIGLLVGLVVLVSACAAPQSSSNREPSTQYLDETPFYDPPFATLDPDDPVVIGDGPNTVRPSGSDRTGLDATDEICDEMKRDLEDAITQTLRDLRDAGMPSDFMPSRADLKKDLSGALRANGCSGF